MAAAWTFTAADGILTAADGLGGLWTSTSAGTVRTYNTNSFEVSFAGTKLYFEFSEIVTIGGVAPGDATEASEMLIALMPTGGGDGIFA